MRVEQRRGRDRRGASRAKKVEVVVRTHMMKVCDEESSAAYGHYSSAFKDLNQMPLRQTISVDFPE